MNILPKKSWHVLSRKNIEKVRKDEAEAKAREEELAQRAALAEQEARVEVMRKRARQREGLADEEEEEEGRREQRQEGGEKRADSHINFFADLESGIGLQLTNAEHEAEKKADQEKLEKRIGLLNYLVDKDKSDTEPWYMSKAGKRSSDPSAKAEHRKEVMDPLHSMRGYVAAKKKCIEATEGRASETHPYGHREKHREKERDSRDARARDRDGRDTSTDRKLSRKKHKHKRKEDKKAELEKLRRERRKREEAEKVRVEALLRQHYGMEASAGPPSSGPQAVEELPGRYNSQFNPHLARH